MLFFIDIFIEKKSIAWTSTFVLACTEDIELAVKFVIIREQPLIFNSFKRGKSK